MTSKLNFQNLIEYKQAFETFFKENKRYPSSEDCDASDYIPSSKTIQRKFGSMKQLRKELGFDKDLLDLRKSKHRSEQIKNSNENNYLKDCEIKNLLIEKYSEFGFEISPTYKDINEKADYFITSENIYLETFFPSTLRSLQTSLNLKLKKIKNSKEKIFIIVLNEKFTQPEIDLLMANKKDPIPDNVTVIAFKTFINNK